jgi:hypothetical protein
MSHTAFPFEKDATIAAYPKRPSGIWQNYSAWTIIAA